MDLKQYDWCWKLLSEWISSKTNLVVVKNQQNNNNKGCSNFLVHKMKSTPSPLTPATSRMISLIGLTLFLMRIGNRFPIYLIVILFSIIFHLKPGASSGSWVDSNNFHSQIFNYNILSHFNWKLNNVQSQHRLSIVDLVGLEPGNHSLQFLIKLSHTGLRN